MTQPSLKLYAEDRVASLKKTKQLPKETKTLLIIGLVLALVVALPLFIWAILTQTFDIRKRGATIEPPPPPPSGSPTASPSPGPCQHFEPSISISPTQQNAYKGQTITFEVTVKNNNTLACGHGTLFSLQAKLPQLDWRSSFSNHEISLSPGESRTEKVYITTSLNTKAFTFPLSIIVSDTSGYTAALDAMVTVLEQSIGPQTLEFKIKLAGVNDGRAEGMKATIRFVNPTVDLVTPSIVFNHAGNGLYRAQVNLVEALAGASNYTIYIKGEKHLARKFCSNYQSERCVGNGNITIPEPIPNLPIQIYDFSQLPLEPGDLPTQDGRVDLNDFRKAVGYLTTTCSQQTDEEKFSADVDYSGCVNVYDLFLIRKSLETKYDEF